MECLLPLQELCYLNGNKKRVVIISKISYTNIVHIRGVSGPNGKDRRMMKETKNILCFFMILQLLFCMSCGKKAVLYDSDKAQREEALETDLEDTVSVEASKEEASSVCVYVCGEVMKPGVYELTAKSRIGEAIEAAGGMTEEAASTWLNLAEHVTDGQKIEVPSKEEAKELVLEREQQESGLINLNTATAEQLMSLSGIGESKAEDILNYRKQHGDFQTIEDLMQIPGIKERVFEKIKDQITV